jgi:hypothetical protein
MLACYPRSDMDCELYALNRLQLWEVLKFMSTSEQRMFLIQLLTEVNGSQHSLFSESILRGKKQAVERAATTSINNLYILAAEVLDEIIDEGIRQGKIAEDVRNIPDIFLFRGQDKEEKVDCPWFNVLLQYEKKKVALMTESGRYRAPVSALGTLRSQKSLHTEEGNGAVRRDSLPGATRRRSVEVESDMEERVKALFRFIDVDGSGMISREELKQSLSALTKTDVSWITVDDMMARAFMMDAGRGGGLVDVSKGSATSNVAEGPESEEKEKEGCAANGQAEVSFDSIKTVIMLTMIQKCDHAMEVVEEPNSMTLRDRVDSNRSKQKFALTNLQVESFSFGG